MNASDGRRQALRRYPALAFLIAAGALALLLPSGLIIPTSGPSTLAEYAPVPGKGEGAGNVSELGQAQSGDIGFGSGKGGVSGLPPTLPSQKRPRLKRCVGKPPRQTEDPLSPPCVAFFDGDNGGSTTKGVTADEIRMVYVNAGCNQDNSTLVIDYEKDPPDSVFYSITQASLIRYFNNRYQTYGRRVHLFMYRAPCAQQQNPRSLVLAINERLDPFAIIPAVITDIAVSDPSAGGVEAARLGIFAVPDSPRRALAQAYAPYLLSFPPDEDNFLSTSAEFICQKLAGRTARHAGTPDIQQRKRKFGLAFEEEGLRDRFASSMKGRCDVEVVVVPVGKVAADASQIPVSVAKMRTENVTTVVYQSKLSYWATSMDGSGWYPEILIPAQAANLNAVTVRTFSQGAWRNAFGFNFERRLGPLEEQDWYMAFQEACPNCTVTSAREIYNQLSLLFWGIQASGPRLTPQNLDRGLHAIPQRPSPDPFTPAAYFSPGNYSWIKDAAVIWWDITGQPPGRRETGCYRLVEDGKRYREVDWKTRANDNGIKEPGQVCQGPTTTNG